MIKNNNKINKNSNYTTAPTTTIFIIKKKKICWFFFYDNTIYSSVYSTSQKFGSQNGWKFLMSQKTKLSKECDILLNLAEKLDTGTEKAVNTSPPTD